MLTGKSIAQSGQDAVRFKLQWWNTEALVSLAVLVLLGLLKFFEAGLHWTILVEESEWAALFGWYLPFFMALGLLAGALLKHAWALIQTDRYGYSFQVDQRGLWMFGHLVAPWRSITDIKLVNTTLGPVPEVPTRFLFWLELGLFERLRPSTWQRLAWRHFASVDAQETALLIELWRFERQDMVDAKRVLALHDCHGK